MLPFVVDSFHTRTVLVQNIASEVNHRKLREFFSDPIMSIVFVKNVDDDSKQTALVVFEKESWAANAISRSDECQGVLASSGASIRPYSPPTAHP